MEISFPACRKISWRCAGAVEREAPLIAAAMGRLWSALFESRKAAPAAVCAHARGLTEGLSQNGRDNHHPVSHSDGRDGCDVVLLYHRRNAGARLRAFGAYWNLQRFADLMNEFKDVTGNQFSGSKISCPTAPAPRATGEQATFNGMTTGETARAGAGQPAGRQPRLQRRNRRRWRANGWTYMCTAEVGADGSGKIREIARELRSARCSLPAHRYYGGHAQVTCYQPCDSLSRSTAASTAAIICCGIRCYPSSVANGTDVAEFQVTGITPSDWTR